MKREELTHLTKIAQTVWTGLSDYEREAFYIDTGTIGFVEAIADLLQMDISTMTLAEFDEIWNTIEPSEENNVMVPIKLNDLADELRKNVEHRLDVALLTIVETLAELDDGDTVSYSCGNIGIGLTRDCICLYLR